MDTISLLKEKLLEVKHERDAYENKMNKLLQHAKSAKESRDKMADTIKSLEKSILDMKALGKKSKKKEKT